MHQHVFQKYWPWGSELQSSSQSFNRLSLSFPKVTYSDTECERICIPPVVFAEEECEFEFIVLFLYRERMQWIENKSSLSRVVCRERIVPTIHKGLLYYREDLWGFRSHDMAINHMSGWKQYKWARWGWKWNIKHIHSFLFFQIQNGQPHWIQRTQGSREGN